ncbi:hypothetical protein [Tenacibaculum aiptasiae]|uniref:hypothetical protein n=1 Tax=Tenacibaculum aiptasiae TaxID=426481 RepID=UPI00232F3827|nr:hypothetical protein [Tenacibaculum aiptasiae]
MKKVFLLPIICYSLLIGCQTSDSDVLENEKKEIITSGRVENIPLIRKVTASFNKVLQDKEMFYVIKNIFEDDVIIKESLNDKVFILSDNIFEDHVMLKASFIFEDHIIMKTETIKDDVLPKASFKESFIKNYKILYPEDEINIVSILKQLPKLYFGLPVSCIKNYNSWKEKGFPVLAKSYDTKNNHLQKITRENAIDLIGIESFNKLIKNTNEPYDNYYLLKSETSNTLIAARKNQGNIIILNNDDSNINSFRINNKIHYNNITVSNLKETYTIAQNNMMTQTYLDLPQGCTGYYSFICGSLEMQQYYSKMQELANETCQTIWKCIPCCDSYTGGIIYYTTIFEPNSIKCKKTMDYIKVLSMYSLEMEDN